MVKSACLFIRPDDEKIWQFYDAGAANLPGDSGFDLYVPETVTFKPRETKKVSMGISCMMRTHKTPDPLTLRDWIRFIIWLWTNMIAGLATIFPFMQQLVPDQEQSDPVSAFLIYPRSSIANGKLRLANSVGVVDSGYRGPIMAALDNTSDEPYELQAGTRIVQLCHPGLIPIRNVARVQSFETTLRGSRGFGSTGVSKSI